MKNVKIDFIKISMIFFIFTAAMIPALLLQGCSSVKLQMDDSLPGPISQPQDAADYKNGGSKDAADGNGTDAAKNDTGTEKNGTVPADNGTGSTDNSVQQDAVPEIDLNAVKPDETGRIMVVMFHNFIEEYKNGNKEYTMTFDAFEKLLDTLYSMDYRLISLNDYLNGNIDTPAGRIPMVFTFDDGTAGQFNLIDEGGMLKANPRSAVGILEEFNKTHPNFGTKGTFYINLGCQTFGAVGTVSQRLEYLKSKGFELGNHTYSHINLKEAKTAAKIQEEIGGNQKKMYEMIPDYTFTTFSLPFGAPSKDLKQYVIKGEFEGVQYENLALMEVGWDPAPSPFSIKFDPLSTHRVRSPGITSVDSDLTWWLANMKRDRQYVSDGNPAAVTVPEASAKYVDQARLNGRTLITY